MLAWTDTYMTADAMVSDDATVATPSALYRAYVYAVYHLIERPIKRVARKIAHSGHWGY
jgi:hypothetical protein